MLYEQRLHQAITLQQSGDLAGALAAFEKLLKRNKKNPDLLARTSIAALNLGHLDSAQGYAKRLLRIIPNAGVAYNVLGTANFFQGHIGKAHAHFKKAVTLSPDDAQSHVNMGEVLTTLNKPDQAYVHLETAVQIAPRHAQARYALGTTCRSLGNSDKAEEMFRSVLDLEPFHADAWKSLAYMGRTSIDSDTERLKEAEAHYQHAPLLRAKILFALFSSFERAKDHDQAYGYLEQANRLVASTQGYDVADDEAHMRTIADVFSADRFEGLCVDDDNSRRPIFIVGMPRSGTTLVEQVLAGHSKVEACGELPFLSSVVGNVGARPGRQYPDTVMRWKQSDYKKIAQAYLDELKVYEIAAPSFTDKMPGNFLYLGVIALAFPNARIIHCQRDPIDTCLANYRQMFTEHHQYTFDQDDLVRYFKAYKGLMAHWHSVMGGRILDITYEDMVQSPMDQAQRMLAFCGLEWESDCLDVANTDRTIRTASSSQIREGIHNNFVARWKRYEKHLHILTDGLKSFYGG